MKLSEVFGRPTYPRGAPENHMFILDQLLRFVGATQKAPSVMFPRPWPSLPGKIGQAVCGIGFLAGTFISVKRKVLLYSETSQLLFGEAVLTDKDIRARAFRCALSLKPFLIVKTGMDAPIARACDLLGIDRVDDLNVHLVINVLIVLFAKKDGLPVAIHLAASPGACRTLEGHRRGLEVANAAALPPSVREAVPALVSFQSEDGFDALAQSHMPGAAHHLKELSDADFYALMGRVVQPLLDFRGAVTESTQGADAELIFEKFPLLSTVWPEMRTTIDPLVERLQMWQRERGMVPVLVHGDYWIRNVLYDESGTTVTGIIDWERARPDGTPGLDALHLVLTSLAERRGDLLDYLDQTWTRQWESELLAEYVWRIQCEFGLTDDDIGYLGTFFYLDELYKQQRSGRALPPHRRMKFMALKPAMDEWMVRTSRPVVETSSISELVRGI